MINILSLCPQCKKKIYFSLKGRFPVACSSGCKEALLAKAENQMLIWGITNSRLSRTYQKVVAYQAALNSPLASLRYRDFILWLWLNHSRSKLEIEDKLRILEYSYV